MKLWNKIRAIEWKLSWHRRSEPLKIRAWSIEIGHKRKQSIIIFSNFPTWVLSLNYLCLNGSLFPATPRVRAGAAIISKLWCNTTHFQASGLQKGLQGGKIPHYRSKQMKIYFWVCWTNSISNKTLFGASSSAPPSPELQLPGPSFAVHDPGTDLANFLGKFSLNRGGSVPG